MNIGFKINFLEVLERVAAPSGKKTNRGPYFRCLCHRCSNAAYIATSGDINSGRIKSCGCLRDSEEFAQRYVTHGQRRQNKGITSRAYKAWAEMKRRCNDKGRVNWQWYGGCGITYAPVWEDFSAFYEDMGDCPDGLELDRIDNERGYFPGNCRWATHKENCNNRSPRRDTTTL